MQLPPRLQAAIQAGRMTPEQAQARHQAFLANQQGGPQPPAGLSSVAQLYNAPPGVSPLSSAPMPFLGYRPYAGSLG